LVHFFGVCLTHLEVAQKHSKVETRNAGGSHLFDQAKTESRQVKVFERQLSSQNLGEQGLFQKSSINQQRKMPSTAQVGRL